MKQLFFIVPQTNTTSGIPGFQLGMREEVEDEFGLIERKQGFVPVTADVTKHPAILKGCEEGKIKFVFGRRQPNSTLYELQRIPVTAENKESSAAQPAVEGEKTLATN